MFVQCLTCLFVEFKEEKASKWRSELSNYLKISLDSTPCPIKYQNPLIIPFDRFHSQYLLSVTSKAKKITKSLSNNFTIFIYGKNFHVTSCCLPKTMKTIHKIIYWSVSLVNNFCTLLQLSSYYNAQVLFLLFHRINIFGSTKWHKIAGEI